MSKNRQGFTIIEVILFLGITGLIFMAIVASTSNVLSRQRYNDSTQNFAEFLRGVYGKLTSIENYGNGRSERAIYGKLITFGESHNLNGEENVENEIFTYDIIGDVSGSISADDVIKSLASLNADVVVKNGEDVEYAGINEHYATKWMARIEQTNSTELFKGAVMVVRSATSGTIYTYVLNGETIEVNSAVKFNTPKKLLTSQTLNKFVSNQPIDFCISSEDGRVYNGKRRDVRIIANARNSSGVEVMPLDDPDQNACQSF